MSVSDRFARFGVTIFTEMTELARKHDAINLGQGFPNWAGADFVKEAARESMLGHENDQYPPSPGIPLLREAVAARYGPLLGRDLDPDNEITITCGCTEALAASFLGLVNPGDEVVLIEPFYDAYPAHASMVGADPKFVTLEPPDFRLDAGHFADAISHRTKLLVLNNPHNPSGRVFERRELEALARLCVENDVIVIADEVYEEMTFGPPHIRMATLPGMWERTLTLSSLGKTFSLTGWKVGWAIGPADLTRGIRAAHQFLTFTTPTPVQHGATAALGAQQAFFDAMRTDYQAKRDLLAEGLTSAGFDVHMPQGTYFLMAGHPGPGTDRDFCRHLAEHSRVVAIPPSVFYSDPRRGERLVRFAFCKDEMTLREAIERITVAI